jgi:hypothetical protein
MKVAVANVSMRYVADRRSAPEPIDTLVGDGSSAPALPQPGATLIRGRASFTVEIISSAQCLTSRL